MNVVTIGLDEDVVQAIRKRVGTHGVTFLSHPVPPHIYTSKGVAYVAHPNIMNYYVSADFVLWYGYFEDPELPKQTELSRMGRLALALASGTATYPNIQATLPFDDKMLSLVMANRVDGFQELPRGFFPPSMPVEVEPDTVLKWGNQHCGDGKQLLVTGEEPLAVPDVWHTPVLSEPFIKGTSHRILLVGDYACWLKYESKDWRKNVGGTVEVCKGCHAGMTARAQSIAEAYGLDVLGVDFIVDEDSDELGDSAMLLEVNAYPSLGQDAKPNGLTSKEVFCREAAKRILELREV